MLNLITTVLDLAAAALVVAAVSLATAAAVPQPFSLAAGLGVAGIGCAATSLIIAPLRKRGKRGKAASR